MFLETEEAGIFRLGGKTFKITKDGYLQLFTPTVSSGMGEIGGFWNTIKKIATVAIPAYVGYQGYQNYKATGSIFPASWGFGTKTASAAISSGNAVPGNRAITYQPPVAGQTYPNFTPITDQFTPGEWRSGGGYDPVTQTGGGVPVAQGSFMDTATQVAQLYLAAKSQPNAPQGPLIIAPPGSSGGGTVVVPTGGGSGGGSSGGATPPPEQPAFGMSQQTMMLVGGGALLVLLLATRK